MNITSAQEFKSKYRKLLKLPSGRTVEIRKIENDPEIGFMREQLIETIGREPQSVNDVLERAKKNKEIYELSTKILNTIITNGVVRPKISDKPLEQLSEDEVHISDVGTDMMALVKGILEFSGVDLSNVTPSN